MQINFVYEIRDIIRIKGLNVEGIIVGYYYGETGPQYQVSYFLNGEVCLKYLYPEQICHVTGEEEPEYKRW